MPKNIILCSDGTGNSAMKGRGTNVFKIYEAIDLNGHKFNKNLLPQVAFYDDGVGTESFKLFKILGGAFGWGLSRNVKELYTALARCYEIGDQIYLFGFSRGAFTVRQLGGFIIGCGIIDRKHWKTDAELRRLVRKAFRKYRKRYRTWLGNRIKNFFKSDKELREQFRQTYAVKDDKHVPEGKVRIRFIGVWDTVAAVGLPFDQLANFINNVFYRFKFPDRQLSVRVDKACHALAIDDERRSFHPEMWDESKEEKKDRIEQVWFSGAHSNVGGGYPKQGMSLVALDWLMAKAELQDLRFVERVRDSYREQHNINDKLYDSRSGPAVYYRYEVRHIDRICAKNNLSVDIHSSTFDRIAVGTEGYAPVNLPGSLNIVSTEYPSVPAAKNQQGLKKIENIVKKAISDSKRLLDRSRKWMWIRRYSHYAFLVSTLALVWFANQFKSETLVESSLLNGILGFVSFIVGQTIADFFLKPILTHPVFGFTLLLLIILFYFIGMVAKNRIKSIFSIFWCSTFRNPG